jgi:hypothetical protein
VDTSEMLVEVFLSRETFSAVAFTVYVRAVELLSRSATMSNKLVQDLNELKHEGQLTVNYVLRVDDVEDHQSM